MQHTLDKYYIMPDILPVKDMMDNKMMLEVASKTRE